MENSDLQNRQKSGMDNPLKDFLQNSSDSVDKKEIFYTSKKCVYCKRTENYVPITKGSFKENICLDCERELVRQKEHCQKIIDEVVHNMECLFTESWNKHIKIKECIKIKKRIKKEGFKQRISSWVKDKWMDVIWEVSIEPDILQAKIESKKNICTLKIRTNTPAGIITAETAYIVIKDYLMSKVEKGMLDKESLEGFSMWYMIHYLYHMDYERYGDGYDQIIEARKSEKSDIYKKLREKKHPQNGEFMPLAWEIRQMCGDILVRAKS